MKNAEYRFTLDLQKIQSQVTMQVNSGDTARTLLITLTNGGMTHKLGEGSTAVLSAKKSNGKYLFNSCSIVENNTVIRYDFTPATTDVPGIMQCEILITDPVENTIISPRFTMIVDALINGDEVLSESENTFMIKAMAQEGMREINEATRVANESERQKTVTLNALELKDAKLRIASLEAAATGNICQTVDEEYTSPSMQITDDVLPYGIISRVDAGTKRIEIGMPYDITGAKGYRTYAQCVAKRESVVMVKGSRYGIMLPCVLPTETTASVFATGKNSADERVSKFDFKKKSSDTSDSSVGEEKHLNNSITLTSPSTHVLITKYGATTALTTDLEISNIKVIVDDPNVATIYNPLTIEIPDALTAYLEENYAKYDTLGNYIDLTTRTFHYYYDGDTELASPQIVDVSNYIGDKMGIVELRSGNIIRMIGTDGKPHSGKYTLSYKQKIGG